MLTFVEKYHYTFIVENMKRNIIASVLTMLFLCQLNAQEHQHFITDSNYRNKVETAFQDKMKLIGGQFFQLEGLSASPVETEAMKFLYAYMPIADATDHPTAFYLANVRTSLRARKEMAWGESVPELLFRHFVLPLRVNNEALDMSRQVFFKELKERVKGMTMKEAILEVNHWCHEHVTYQPSDARTLSPLACMKNAIGRCGEESTFTVSALRSIGIPARQVYTPRWAHTDDNHAWVEAWADGEWYFLGACEPEPVLNLGWFNAPASRALLMHTRAFGDYNGPEEVMLRTSNFTEINLIENYGSLGRVDFMVVDHNGKAVKGARVDFRIYNYAEFYPAVTKYTDAQGATFLTAGKGDMLVWASKDGWYGYAKASFGKDRLITIQLRLNNQQPSTISFKPSEIDIVPPAERAMVPEVSQELAAVNKTRLAYEDSLRKAYESTFLSKSEAQAVFPAAADLLETSRSNWQTVLDFLLRHTDNQQRAMGILKSLSIKDLRDITIDILEDNFYAKSDQLCPRVEDEMITSPFKQYLEKAWAAEAKRPGFSIEQIQKDPSVLVKWVKENIRINPDRKSLRIAQTPVGVWKSRVTDIRSRDIFFVDLARSLGIEAQKDIVTGKVQYKSANQWIDVDFDSNEQKSARTGTLRLTYKATPLLDDPKYYSHFSITRIFDDGTTQLMNFEEGQVDMGGGTSWSNTFKNGAQLDEGTYLLTTGTRLASGSVLATNQFFTIKENTTTQLELKMRKSGDQISVIGSFDSESKFNKDGQEVSILSQTGRGYFVVGVLGLGQEPTNHALRDIAKVRKEIDKWNRPMVLLFESQKEVEAYRKEHADQMPRNTVYGIDTNGAIRQQIARQMKLKNNGQLPVFIIADTFNRVVFVSQGYTIGLGEQLVKVANKL